MPESVHGTLHTAEGEPQCSFEETVKDISTKNLYANPRKEITSSIFYLPQRDIQIYQRDTLFLTKGNHLHRRASQAIKKYNCSSHDAYVCVMFPALVGFYLLLGKNNLFTDNCEYSDPFHRSLKHYLIV